MADAPSRNDPCPCGSGQKYKHCCMNESAWYEHRLVSGGLVALLLVVALVLIGVMLYSGGSTPDCPPGQVWSQAHGHCH